MKEEGLENDENDALYGFHHRAGLVSKTLVKGKKLEKFEAGEAFHENLDLKWKTWQKHRKQFKRFETQKVISRVKTIMKK